MRGAQRVKACRALVRLISGPSLCLTSKGRCSAGAKLRVKSRQDAQVNSVELISPPMTTVASGFWTSAPVPVASAIGTNPSEATSTLMTTGRSRVSAPRMIACSSGIPSYNNCPMNVSMTKSLSTATPDNAMKPTADEIENVTFHRILRNN